MSLKSKESLRDATARKAREAGQPIYNSLSGQRQPINSKGARARRVDPQDRAWVKAVKARALGYCQRCGEMGVHAHHLYPKGGHYSHLRHDENNGLFVCSDCHTYAHLNMRAVRKWAADSCAYFKPLYEKTGEI